MTFQVTYYNAYPKALQDKVKKNPILLRRQELLSIDTDAVYYINHYFGMDFIPFKKIETIGFVAPLHIPVHKRAKGQFVFVANLKNGDRIEMYDPYKLRQDLEQTFKEWEENNVKTANT